MTCSPQPLFGSTSAGHSPLRLRLRLRLALIVVTCMLLSACNRPQTVPGSTDMPAADRPLTILFYGDSTTGWSDLSLWFKYTHIIACMIEARCGPGQAVVLNRAVGGNTSADLLARLDQDVLAAKPDIVVLLTGGNDAGIADASAANIDQLIRRITAVCPRLLLMQYQLVMKPEVPEAGWAHVDDGYEVVGAAAARHGLPLLDMAPHFTARLDRTIADDEKDYRRFGSWHGESRYRRSELVGADGIHLNGGGEIVYATAIFAKLRELGWLPPARP